MAMSFLKSPKSNQRVLILLLCACFIIYTLFSYLLLFRDIRALLAISGFYPQLSILLFKIRSALLHLGLNSLFSFILAFTTLLAFFAYFRSLSQKIAVSLVIKLSLVFALIVFFSYPVLSTDIFDYILSDRQAINYHVGVWAAPPESVVPKSDRFYNLASWQDKVNPYGPVNQFFYSLAGSFSGNDLLQSLLVHKLVVVVFYLGTFWLLYQSLKTHPPEKVSRTLVLIFWNPLFVLEIVGSGHNDILMTFFLFLGIFLYIQKKLILSAITFSLAILIKNIPMFLLPLLTLSLLRTNFRQATAFAVTCALTLLLGLIVIGKDLPNFFQRIIFASTLYWQSLPQLLHLFIKNERPLFFFATLATFICLSFLVFRKKIDPLTAFVIFLFLFLTILSSVYWNWYVLWLLPLLPYVSSKMERPVLTLSLTSAVAYPAYWLSLRFLPHNFPAPAIIYLLIALPPLALFIYEKFLQQKSL